MTEEQKRFKILKRTSYEEQISQENKKATESTFLFGFSAATAIILFFSAATQQNIVAAIKLVDVGLGLLNTGFGIYHLKDLIQAICKKTMLQGKIEDINTELESPKNEKTKSRGMKIW